MKEKSPLKEIASLFLKLGTIAFGGPAAHIAMMEEEVVRKRKWMSHEHFLDLMGITNLIPGPNSTEMTMHCGHERGGWKGLIVAGVSFIFPAVIITAIFAWLYQQYGRLPQVQPFIYGIKPAVIAIILAAMIKLSKKALKNIELGILGVLTVIAGLLGINEIAALFACGGAGIILYFLKNLKGKLHSFHLAGVSAFFHPDVLQTFWIFLKVGALLYGSGYVLFAFLDAELVSTGLLTQQQLMDAVAVGQFTPGPVLFVATFVGWQLFGVWGALAATVGIFLPSFLFVALVKPLLPKLRRSRLMSAFLDAVNIGAVAVILVVGVKMSREALTDWKTAVIAIVSLLITQVFKKVNSAFIVIGGAAAGYLLILM